MVQTCDALAPASYFLPQSNEFVSFFHHWDYTFILAVVIMITLILRWIGQCLHARNKRLFHAAHYLALFYGVLGVCVVGLCVYYGVVMICSEWLTGYQGTGSDAWFDCLVELRGNCNNTTLVQRCDNVTKIKDDWLDKADLSHAPVLRFLCLISPVPLVGAYAATMYHVFGFIRASKDAIGPNELRRERVLMVVALPPFYGTMSFWALCHSLESFTYGPKIAAQVTGTLANAIGNFDLAYEGAMGVADFYEAIAIWFFGMLMLRVADQSTNKTADQSGLICDEEEQGDDHITSHASSPNVTNELTRLQYSRSDLVMSGINWFCLACLMTCINSMFLPSVYFFFGAKDEELQLQAYTNREYIETFLYGFGFATSCVALQNLIVLEQSHGKAMEHEGFAVFLKFLSAKMLVSLVFLQSLILSVPPLSDYHPLHKKMLKAVLLCLECFLLALFHMKAWGNDEKWLTKETRVTKIEQLKQKLLVKSGGEEVEGEHAANVDPMIVLQ